MSTPAPRPVLRPLAILVSFLLALAGLTLPALPAAAAAGDVSGATLDWGVRDSFRSYLTGPIAHGHWTATGVTDATPFGWTGGTGSAPGGTGTVSYPGSIQFQGHQGFGVDPAEYALDLTFSDVRIRVTGATTAELVLDARSRGLADPTTFAELDDVVFATLNLAGGTDTSTSGVVAWSGVPATLTAQGAVAFGGFYAEGAALAPASFSWPVEAAAPTTVTPVLTVSPTGTAVAGTAVTLTATATPAVSGTVQFFDGATALGAPANVTAGVATLTTTALSIGSHSLTAALTTPDSGYVGATSTALAYAITAPGGPVDPGVTPGNVVGGTATWGISTYLNAGSPGRANPSPADYVAPSTYDAITKLSTWGTAVGSVDEDGSAVLGFSGTSVNFAATGNAWFKLADLRVELDDAGNGTVSALVSYRTGGNLAATPTRGPERVDVVALAGNMSGATLTSGSAAWSGLAGTWDADFLAFLAGDSGAGVAAFTYASTITNDASLNAGARLPSTFAFAVTLEEPTVYVPTEYDLGSATWGISSYLNAGSPGRANPSPTDYVAPAAYDATTKLSTWGGGHGTIEVDGSAELAFSGASMNFAATGNAWLRLADLTAELDADGNGTVSALVSYRTGGTTAAAPTRGPTRLDIVTLAGNDVTAVQDADSVTWAGLTGTWDADLLAFLAGDSGNGIAAWTYASTVSNDTSLNAGARLPAAFTFELGIEPPPTFDPAEYDLGSFTWGISSYLNAGSPGRANPSPTDYSAPATFDATTKLSTWGGGSGTVVLDGSTAAGFAGTSVNFASTGNAWLRFADPQVSIDAAGNGTVTALVSYRTGGNPAAAPTRGPARIAIVTLAGNETLPVQGADSLAWTGLTGTWHADLLAFLAGDTGAGVAAWTYASTISNDTSLNGGARLPAPISLSLGQAPDPVATGVTLTASPAESAVAGSTVALTAVVAPAVAGTVTFTDGATALGAVVLADGVGTATWSLTATAGTHAYRASFAPLDGWAYLASQSAIVAQTVTAAVLPAPGSLTWGVKASFRSYVLGDIAHGTITSAGGASPVAGGYSFPQSSSDVASSGLGAVGYRGSVTFTGHAGALNLRIADPIVRITSSTAGVLSVATAGGRVDLATIDLSRAVRSVGAGGAVSYVGAPATLTAAGATSFAGFYSAGEALDPVSFTVGSNNPVNGAGSTSSNPAPTTRTPAAAPPATEGITTSQDEVFVEGGEYTFTAGGFQPNETDILIVVYSTPTVLATDATADANGVVTWTGVLPAGLTGAHTLTFQGSVDRGIVIDIAAAEAVGCPVEGAELNWGFKESFRAYIDGSIAHGEWTTADGATYETPLFTWATGAGGYDADTGDADLAFTGSVRFTGHGGVLDTTIANPRVVIVGDRAVLLLDVSGTTQDGTPVSSTGVEFAELDLAAAEQVGGGDLVAFTGIPAVLTEAGAAAFGTYEAGSELDPIDLLVTVDPACVQPAGAVEEAEAAPEVEPASETAPILWIVLAIILALAIAVVAVILVRRTRRTA